MMDEETGENKGDTVGQCAGMDLVLACMCVCVCPVMGLSRVRYHLSLHRLLGQFSNTPNADVDREQSVVNFLACMLTNCPASSWLVLRWLTKLSKLTFQK